MKATDLQFYNFRTQHQFTTGLYLKTSGKFDLDDLVSFDFFSLLPDTAVLVNKGSSLRKADFEIFSKLYSSPDLVSHCVISDRQLEVFVLSKFKSSDAIRKINGFRTFDKFYELLLDLNLRDFIIFADSLVPADLPLLERLDKSEVDFSFAINDSEVSQRAISNFIHYLNHKPDQLTLPLSKEGE